MTARDSRHLSWENFAELVNAGEPALEPLSGAPSAAVYVGAGGAVIGLLVAANDPVPPIGFAAIEIRSVLRDGQRFLDVSTTERDLYPEFYAFACTVADRVQLEDMTAPSALADAVDSWGALLEPLAALSLEKQIGLIGELWVLERIARAQGWLAAVAAWKESGSEEHDFGLEQSDLEVKTTTVERRVHVIGSLTQLVPLPNRPLWLCSIQLTGAGQNEGFTLTDRVSSVQETIAANGPAGALTAFRDRLSMTGWQDAHAPIYRRRYALRSDPMLVPIDDAFPALTPALLKPLGAEQSRIVQVTYRVAVDGLGFSDRSDEFDAVLPSEGS